MSDIGIKSEKLWKMRMNEGLVSVIIPVYNKQIYLEDCLNSLFNQTLKDLEIITIDNGSTDGSWETLCALAEKDPRVALLRIPHSGPSVARNTGIKSATGEYITFVDADDFVEPTYIENLVLNIGDADLCISGYKQWNQRRESCKQYRCYSATLDSEELYSKLKTQRIIRETISGIGWKLYRRSFLADHQIAFRDSISMGEDLLFISCVLSHAKKVVCIENTEYIVRIHDMNSLTHQGYSVDMYIKLLDEYSILLMETEHPALVCYFRWQMVSFLGLIGRVICYQDIRIHIRKQRFFEVARKYNLTNQRYRWIPDTKLETVTRFSLMTRTFLPFYCLTKLWYLSNKEERQQYAAHSEDRETVPEGKTDATTDKCYYSG